MPKKTNKSKSPSFRFKEYSSKGFKQNQMSCLQSSTITLTTDQAEESVLPIPEPTPAILMVWAYLKDVSRDHNKRFQPAEIRRRMGTSSGSSKKINSYTAFKSYYSRMFSIEGGVISVKEMNTLLSQVWATYEHKSKWNIYALQYSRYPRKIKFVDWLFTVPKKVLPISSPMSSQSSSPSPFLEQNSFGSPDSILSDDSWGSPYPAESDENMIGCRPPHLYYVQDEACLLETELDQYLISDWNDPCLPSVFDEENVKQHALVI